jgi:hypothetical protein
MDNRILQLTVQSGQLSPAQSDVWIRVVPEKATATTELRGRLMGPRCPYAETVEVAYPLRPPPPGRIPLPREGLLARVIIPEACFWEPESPFLYQGPIELWQEGQRCDQIVISHGLRTFRLGPQGLRFNSRPLSLRGQRITSCSEAEALELRRAGRNLLVVPVEATALHVWDRADQLGFLVLGRIQDDSEATLRNLYDLSRHPSCLGWLIEEAPHPPLDQFPPGGLVGLTVGSTSARPPLSSAVHFLFGAPELANLGKPVLVQGEAADLPSAGLILGNVA